jgi:hypothetical protein
VVIAMTVLAGAVAASTIFEPAVAVGLLPTIYIAM